MATTPSYPRSSTIKEATLDRNINHVLVAAPSFTSLSQEILSLPESANSIAQGGVSWGKFEDGFPNLMIKNVENFRSREVVFLVDFLDLQEIFAQLSGTMERVDTEGQVATAMTLATLLSSIPLTASGPAKLVIYDIHALQERFYFGPSTIPVLMSAVPIFLDVLANEHAGEKIAIAFPDEGAMKRFAGQFKGYELILCSKVRDGDRRIVDVKEGDAKGRHVFIVDDLVKTGGTLLQCKAAILKKGASHVSAYVTHAVFAQQSWKRFAKIDENDDPQPFEKFYTTNSCPTTTDVLQDIAPFQILSLAASISECIERYKL